MRTDSYRLPVEDLVFIKGGCKAMLVTDLYGNIIFSNGSLIKSLFNSHHSAFRMNILNTADHKHSNLFENALEYVSRNPEEYSASITINSTKYKLRTSLLNDEIEKNVVFTLNEEDTFTSDNSEIENSKAEKLDKLIKNLTDFKYALDESAIVSMTDSKGIITYVNKKFCEISKYSAKELIGKNHNIINSGYHSYEFFKEMWKTIGTGNVWEGEIKNCAKDGSFYWMKSTIVPFMDNNGKPVNYLSIRIDITKTKLYEEKIKRINNELKNNQKLLLNKQKSLLELTRQLKESENDLKKVNAEKDKFLSIIAHDLRNPFHGVLGMANLLASEFEEYSIQEQKSMTENIYSSLRNVYKLVENLLDWATLNNNTMTAEPVNFRLNDKIEEVIKVLVVNVEKKNIQIEKKLKDDCSVFADERMIGSVIQNLLTNAIKFTPANGKIEVSTKRKLNNVEIVIKDTGMGIPEDILKNIFKPDSKISTKGTDNEQGSGLGLLICKEMIDKNQGKISVESRENHGTIFTVELPLRK